MHHRIIRRLLNAIAVLFLVVGLWLTFAQPWLWDVTMPAPRSHAVLRLSVPGLDIGADAHPAAPGQHGYVELWIYASDADDIQLVLHLFGMPALPLEPPLRSAPAAEPAAPIPLLPLPQEPQIRL
jgi:hypothetical protein